MDVAATATAGTTMTLENVISSVSSVFTAILGWLTNTLTFLTDNPILLIFVVLVIAKIVMRICRKWIPGL